MTAMSISSSKPAGPCQSSVALTTITSKVEKKTSFGGKPRWSQKRVMASSK